MKKTKRGVPAPSRLPLAKEVVRMLGATDLGEAAGGSHVSCGQGFTCAPSFQTCHTCDCQ